MAGAGYKLFNTGDVLTAAQVNTYLMEQTVMVFADAAARTTALSGVLSEGMISYLKDTNAVEVYNGSAWVASDDPNAIQNTIVDAKGDLITATAADTPARLAAGSNGDSLVADSGATTGLRWQGNYAAGKNAILNADFKINQRSFSSTTTSATYGFDRWRYACSGGTATYSAQTFTAGSAPVAGYEGTNFARVLTNGQSAAGDFAIFQQFIESVRTFANQTVTISFWAKANSGTPKVAVEMVQYFGTGGSPSADVNTYAGQVTLSTSWARYSLTVAIPSISGKTIGTTMDGTLGLFLWSSAGTTFNSRTGSLGVQNFTFDIWGVQVEAGSVATAFQTATGTIQGELAACQRYYYRHTADSNYNAYATGSAQSTTNLNFLIQHPVEMRVKPTTLDYSNVTTWDGANFIVPSSLSFNSGTEGSNATCLTAAVTGATQYRPYFLLANNTTSSYVGMSAEL